MVNMVVTMNKERIGRNLEVKGIDRHRYTRIMTKGDEQKQRKME